MTISERVIVPHDLSEIGEVWRTHPIWTHLWVSTHGRVWSTKAGRFVGFLRGRTRSHGSAHKSRSCAPRPGTWAVGVARRKNIDVHVLVLETFVGPRPEDHDGDHVNHQKHDNRLENLRWLPIAENRADNH